MSNPSFDLDHVEPLRPEWAIQERNTDELRRCLAHGWEPRQTTSNAGLASRDISLVLRVVHNGWTEGWRLLAQALPYLANEGPVWDGALQYARADIVRDLIRRGKGVDTPTNSGMLPAQAVIHALSQSWNLPWGVQVPQVPAEYESAEELEQAILDTLTVLAEEGGDLLTPFAGEFSVGDLSPNGHTLWTRSVAHRKWRLAQRYFPESWEEAKRQPRALEAAEHLRLSSNSMENSPATLLWLRWLEQFLDHWLEEKRQPLNEPADWPTIHHLSHDRRQQLWFHWAQPSEDGWTGLHQLALKATETGAAGILYLIHQDESPLLEAWHQADAEGMTPAQLWLMAWQQRGVEVPASAIDTTGEGPRLRASYVIDRAKQRIADRNHTNR